MLYVCVLYLVTDPTEVYTATIWIGVYKKDNDYVELTTGGSWTFEGGRDWADGEPSGEGVYIDVQDIENGFKTSAYDEKRSFYCET